MNQKEIEALAKDGTIMSATMMEHFQNIVMAMDGIGAQRRGSKQTRNAAGKKVILDEYVLPNGKTIMAGYLDPFS